ncbi:SPASM domain-containing protein [Thermococcus peptonophilus]|uniref:Fe-S oxidoreductase n=1 Tax=Thermococcus peptonophilus TaxID=53952 RepID=A0A142CV52_9EURY|nr:SPASM domain-containing protein [Thermococcus peptonophilus]AMQ18654.1 Fe-S oxidoreductase [Thermococcus peptonophilus]
MERAESIALPIEMPTNSETIVIGKPPWSNKKHTGKVGRLILQLGTGKGEFFEIYGIPRSIGCIGNNRFILRREPLSLEEFKGAILEFRKMGGKELWLTNYDSIELLLALANFAVEIEIPEVYAVVMFEDLPRVTPGEGIRFIAEVKYPDVKPEELSEYPWLHGVLAVVEQEYLDDVVRENFPGDLYVDVLYPGSIKKVRFNTIELRRILNPTTEKYHDCLAGTVAVTADGYVLPCPLLRNYVVGDLKKEPLKRVTRRKRLRTFWRMTKDSIPACSSCPFKYICHDCRALEYQATGEIDGMEYCPLHFLRL